MTPTRSRIDTLPKLAAMLLSIAANALLCLAPAWPAMADSAPTRPLAVNLRVALGDLHRLATPGLSHTNAEGLGGRIRGALGLLPWLLARAGYPAEADALAARAETPLDAAGRAALIAALNDLAERFPLGLTARTGATPPGPALAEAAAIHEAYGAGCHDGAGGGDPELALPARDLRLMASEEPADLFLARLSLGIKGDETIAFRSPVTDRQLLALLALYRAGWND